MPSDRKQLNVRLDRDTENLLNALQPVVSQAIGLRVSQADLFRLGLIELRKRYMLGAEIPEPVPKPKRGKK